MQTVDSVRLSVEYPVSEFGDTVLRRRSVVHAEGKVDIVHGVSRDLIRPQIHIDEVGVCGPKPELDVERVAASAVQRAHVRAAKGEALPKGKLFFFKARFIMFGIIYGWIRISRFRYWCAGC